MARGWIGTPYRHQASCKGAGTDCLGLVRGVWREAYGAEPELPPAYTPDWGEAAAREVLREAAGRHLVARIDAAEPEAGDVLLFRMRAGVIAKHLGIAVSEDRFIHAYARHGVIENALSAPWRRRVAAIFSFPDRA
ncbi:MAG: NlpC/P60 family protein [Pseudomonadota bacterium]